MKRAALLLLALAAGCHNLTVDRSPGDNPSPDDIKIVRSRLAHTNAAVRATAVLTLEDLFADLSVPLPADDPSLLADLEAAAEARAAEPSPTLPGGDGGDASTLRLVAAAMRGLGPCPEHPFAVLTNDIGRLVCWAYDFAVEGDDSSLRVVQEWLGVRRPLPGEADAARGSPTAIRSRWLLAPTVDAGGEWCRWHAAVGPRLDRLLAFPTGGSALPVARPPAATLAGGAAAPVRLDELPAYGGALDWEAPALLRNDLPTATNGFTDLSKLLPENPYDPVAVDFALRPDPATPDGVLLTADRTFAMRPTQGSSALVPRHDPSNRVLRAEVPLRPGQTALFGTRTATFVSHCEDRTPILSDIPLLGGIFTSNAVCTNAIENLLLVLYTPAARSPAADESHAESAEGAESDSHAESAEGAESEFHAESAEGAESEFHAESAEFAESKSHAESAEGAED